MQAYVKKSIDSMPQRESFGRESKTAEGMQDMTRNPKKMYVTEEINSAYFPQILKYKETGP